MKRIPIKGLTRYYHPGDFHRWWYWLWFNKAIRGVQEAFYHWQDDIDPSLAHLPEHEQYWATHCFGCKRWLCWNKQGKMSGPTLEQQQVLGYIRVKISGTLHWLCTHCRHIYEAGRKA